MLFKWIKKAIIWTSWPLSATLRVLIIVPPIMLNDGKVRVGLEHLYSLSWSKSFGKRELDFVHYYAFSAWTSLLQAIID